MQKRTRSSSRAASVMVSPLFFWSLGFLLSCSSSSTAAASAAAAIQEQESSSASSSNHHHHLVIDFQQDLGAIPDDPSHTVCRKNSEILANALQYNASNHRLIIPYLQTFYLGPGVFAEEVNDTIIQIDGTLRFERLDKKPYSDKDVEPCLKIHRSRNVTITSNFRGLIDGRGSQYWGVPYVGWEQLGEHRPELLVFNRTTDLLMEKIILQDSPYHTLKLIAVNRVEVRNMSIVARRTADDGHGWIDLTAFNTDGIDVSGHNVHVHDVDIWSQDDCIAVKDQNYTETNDFTSSNMTFENINASGLGLVIGSIGGATVQNITFRNSYLHKSVKGIYIKLRHLDEYWSDLNLTGRIQDVAFENITMERPLQFSIFVGPAQQSDNRDPCFANPCSLCWPWSPTAKCHAIDKAVVRNIHLRNVLINNPKMSPGVILGNDKNPMRNITFDNVVVTKGKPVPYARADRLETFPGLKQPIHDKYVPREYMDQQDQPSLWQLNPGLAWMTTLQPQEEEEDDGDNNDFGVHIKPKWQKTSRYFRCKGVQGGVARGKTWPVPGCFENEDGPPDFAALRGNVDDDHDHDYHNQETTRSGVDVAVE